MNAPFKATKKPVTIEAIQLTEHNILQVLQFMEEPVDLSTRLATERFEEYKDIVRFRGGINLKTLESNGETQVADIGDYIIKGVQGEFYPCKPDIFKETYDFNK